MKKLIFEGSSDDTFGEYGETFFELDNCASLAPIQCLITAAEGSLLVVGQYASTHIKKSCWVIGVSMADEDEKIPNWSISYKTAENGYSPSLEILVPDDVSLVWFDNGEMYKEE